MYGFNEKESRYLRSSIWARLCDLKTDIIRDRKELRKSKKLFFQPGLVSHYDRILERDIDEFNLANNILKELSKNRATVNLFPWSPSKLKEVK